MANGNEPLSAAEDELLKTIVNQGWERASTGAYGGEITDAYRDEYKIKAAILLGAEEMLKTLEKGSHTVPLFPLDGI